jgi:hypothetical protein
MPRYEIVPATFCHKIELARHMGAADVAEAWASHHARPFDALLMSAKGSRDTRAALADGRVICMFGVSQPTALSSIGNPWMLGAEDLPRHARAFLRGSRVWMQEQLNLYGTLSNFVDARNVVAIRWLRWLGFTIEEARPFGADRLPFHRFSRGRQ